MVNSLQLEFVSKFNITIWKSAMILYRLLVKTCTYHLAIQSVYDMRKTPGAEGYMYTPAYTDRCTQHLGNKQPLTTPIYHLGNICIQV